MSGGTVGSVFFFALNLKPQSLHVRTSTKALVPDLEKFVQPPTHLGVLAGGCAPSAWPIGGGTTPAWPVDGGGITSVGMLRAALEEGPLALGAALAAAPVAELLEVVPGVLITTKPVSAAPSSSSSRPMRGPVGKRMAE